MVPLQRVTAVLLAAELAIGPGKTLVSPRELSSHRQGDAAVSAADRQPFEPLLRVAIGDLAQRLNIDPAEISIIEMRAVVWPDRSLGCPRPGMAYPQVLQDGALIRLRAQGRDFSYHSGGGRPPFLCEKAR